MTHKSVNLDDLIPGCENFYWREFLWCPKWEVYVYPTKEQYENIIVIAGKLQLIRNYVEQPITVLSGLRPMFYNKWKPPHGVHGARFSAHKVGSAVDFIVKNIKPDRVRSILRLVLDDFEIRVEDVRGASWIHVDSRWQPEGHNYFKP